MKSEKKTEDLVDRLEKMSENKSVFAPPLLSLLNSMNPQMRDFYAEMVSDALKAAESIKAAARDEEFVEYATRKKKNG